MGRPSSVPACLADRLAGPGLWILSPPGDADSLDSYSAAPLTEKTRQSRATGTPALPRRPAVSKSTDLAPPLFTDTGRFCLSCCLTQARPVYNRARVCRCRLDGVTRRC